MLFLRESLVQQAELHHEYGHYAKQASSCEKAPASAGTITSDNVQERPPEPRPHR